MLKPKLNFLKESKVVEKFPSVKKISLKKRSNNQITQLFFARNNIITEEMEYCAIRENEGREKLIGKI